MHRVRVHDEYRDLQFFKSIAPKSGDLRPVLKVALRRAEPSEFRSILPGSARRDSYKTNMTLGSTESNHTPKVSRMGRPGATYKANFSRATSNFSFDERMYSNA